MRLVWGLASELFRFPEHRMRRVMLPRLVRVLRRQVSQETQQLFKWRMVTMLADKLNISL